MKTGSHQDTNMSSLVAPVDIMTNNWHYGIFFGAHWFYGIFYVFFLILNYSAFHDDQSGLHIQQVRLYEAKAELLNSAEIIWVVKELFLPMIPMIMHFSYVSCADSSVLLHNPQDWFIYQGSCVSVGGKNARRCVI